jgi:hypothetical protein
MKRRSGPPRLYEGNIMNTGRMGITGLTLVASYALNRAANEANRQPPLPVGKK